MRLAHRLVAAALVLLAAHPAAAQLTEKEAVAQVKSASKAQLKAFKQNAAAALATLDANLKTVENLLTEASDVTTVGSQMASMAIAYMTDLEDAFDGAKAFVEASASLALDALADGGDLQGLYPEDLSYGTGGLLDTNRAQLIKAAVKSRDAAGKRLRKAADKAEKAAGIAITFELRFPSSISPTSVNQDQLGLANGVSLDLLFAASDLDAADDGLLVFAGQTDSDDEVSVGFFLGLAVNESDTITPEASSGRFTAVFQTVPEGGLVVHAKQGTGGTFHATGEIGMR